MTYAKYGDISIHTPVKSVTGVLRCDRRRPDHFNPHTREECDYLLPATS